MQKSPSIPPGKGQNPIEHLISLSADINIEQNSLKNHFFDPRKNDLINRASFNESPIKRVNHRVKQTAI